MGDSNEGRSAKNGIIAFLFAWIFRSFGKMIAIVFGRTISKFLKSIVKSFVPEKRRHSSYVTSLLANEPVASCLIFGLIGGAILGNELGFLVGIGVTYLAYSDMV